MPVWLLYAFIAAAGALQALGNAMNAELNRVLINPWLAALVSFLPIAVVFAVLLALMPRPMPVASDWAAMPWWAPLGGLVGAVAVFAGLLLTRRIGAGPFAGFLIGANLIFAMLRDQFGWAGLPQRDVSPGRALGVVLMVAGVALISRF